MVTTRELAEKVVKGGYTVTTVEGLELARALIIALDQIKQEKQDSIEYRRRQLLPESFFRGK